MKSGFSLIEVTVALAIFGVAVVALTQSFISGLFTLEKLKFKDSTEDSLMFVYSQVLAVKEKKDLEKGGDIQTIESGHVKWNAKLKKTSVLELYEVMVNVTFDDEKFVKQPQMYEENFYVYRPGWAEEAERDEFLRIHKEKKASVI